MNKQLPLLSFLMGVVVLTSNYLVQFPIKYYGLDEVLTYGAFSYPIAFLITDLTNRKYGKFAARKILENERSFEIEKKIIPIKEIINLIKND